MKWKSFSTFDNNKNNHKNNIGSAWGPVFRSKKSDVIHVECLRTKECLNNSNLVLWIPSINGCNSMTPWWIQFTDITLNIAEQRWQDLVFQMTNRVAEEFVELLAFHARLFLHVLTQSDKLRTANYSIQHAHVHCWHKWQLRHKQAPELAHKCQYLFWF